MKKRYPCLVEHEGNPGFKAKFIGPDTDINWDRGVEYIPTQDGVIEHVYSKQFRAALHYHEMDESEWAAFKEKVLNVTP